MTADTVGEIAAAPASARAAGSAGRAIVATRHYAPEPTGSAPVVQLICEWLANQGGYAVEVFTVRPSYPQSSITPGYANGERDRATENGVQVRRMPTTPVQAGSVLKRVGPEIRFMLDLLAARASGALKPARVVISICPSILTVTGALSLKQRGGRHVAIVHDIPSGLGAALGLGAGALLIQVLKRVEAWTLNRVDHVVVLSAEMGAVLQGLGVRTPMTIMPPQVDTDEIRPAPRPVSDAPFTLMYSGNLGRKQGLDQLLDMAVVLKGLAPEIRILIRGEGASKAALEERVRAETLTNVVFAPLVDKSEISRSLSEGDIHLVPQLPGGSEFSVPSKAYAIMAAGRPLVTTAEPGSPMAELAEASGAILCVPPENPSAFAEAAIRLRDDEALRQRMGANGRRYVESECAKPVVMARFRGLLN